MNVRLAVSNLAWPTADDAEAFGLLTQLGVQGIEVAPTRLGAWDSLSATQLAAYRAKLFASGMVVSSLQALLFGKPDLQLLGDTSLFAAMQDHLRRVVEIGAALGASVLVFGSPRNRLRGSMDPGVAWQLAHERLSVLGEIAASSGVIIGIEPVPAEYGGDFLTSWEDVLRMVKDVANPGVRVHLDTGCVMLGGGDIGAAVKACAEYLAHFHAAQEQLGSFEVPMLNHLTAAKALASVGYGNWISIEMREQAPAPLVAVRQAVEFVRSTYCAGS